MNVPNEHIGATQYETKGRTLSTHLPHFSLRNHVGNVAQFLKMRNSECLTTVT